MFGIDASSNDITVTLPVVGLVTGQWFNFVLIASVPGRSIIIDPQGSTINGAPNLVINPLATYSAYWVYSTGTEYIVL